MRVYMIAGGGNKLPYGNFPRLLLAWLCSEAVKTRSRVLVLGPSLAGDLELAAQLSRKPNVHLGPQALRELPGGPDSFVHQKAERVEKDNEAMAEERDGLIERIKERIEAIYQELQALPEKIKGVAMRFCSVQLYRLGLDRNSCVQLLRLQSSETRTPSAWLTLESAH